MQYRDQLADYWRVLSPSDRVGIGISGFGAALIVFGVGWLFGIGGGMIALGVILVILGAMAAF